MYREESVAQGVELQQNPALERPGEVQSQKTTPGELPTPAVTFSFPVFLPLICDIVVPAHPALLDSSGAVSEGQDK